MVCKRKREIDEACDLARNPKSRKLTNYWQTLDHDSRGEIARMVVADEFAKWKQAIAQVNTEYKSLCDYDECYGCLRFRGRWTDAILYNYRDLCVDWDCYTDTSIYGRMESKGPNRVVCKKVSNIAKRYYH